MAKSPKGISPFLLYFFLLLLAFFSLTGCADQTVSSPPSQMLLITLTLDDSVTSTVFESENLNGNYDGSIMYIGVKNVIIEVNGKTIALEESIREGLVTVEDIMANARRDARNKQCIESWISEHGLNQFTWNYPNYDLCIVMDVYETPDGQQHMINSLSIYPPGLASTSSQAYMDTSGKYLVPIDQEDWGLTFETVEASATGLRIHIQQEGGQQFGNLITDSYMIISGDTEEVVTPLIGWYTEEDFIPRAAIVPNGETTFAIDWTNAHGELPSGSYVLKLWIKDVYDESQVHPLTENYHDIQSYYIEFTIP